MFNTDSRSPPDRRVAYLNGSVATHPAAARVRRSAAAEARIALTDPAVRVVSDFTWEQPLTVAENRPLDEALREMMLAGVRALLVVQGDMVSGLITSYDIQGERSLQFLRASNYTRHDEIEVRHIMTPWELVPTLDWQTVRARRVADLVKFFESTRATHAVIVEYADQGGDFVSGLISRARLERQLGHSIDH
jgi:CBS domain-containing protein